MNEFLLPSVQEATITIVDGESKFDIEVIDIYDNWKSSGDQADKSDGKDWIPYFIKSMKEKFDLSITRTAAVLLVEQAIVKLNSIKKSCSPEPKQ